MIDSMVPPADEPLWHADDLETFAPPTPDAVDLVLETATMMSVFAAQRLVRVDAMRRELLAEAAGRGVGVRDVVERSIRLELAAAMRITEYAAGRLIAQAEALVTRYPGVLDALSGGRITEKHAEIYVDLVDPVTPELRKRIVEPALKLAEAEPVGSFRRALRDLIARVEAATLEQRFQEAVTQRRVWVDQGADGMALLGLHHPAVEVHAIHGRITAMAKAIAAAEGETRTLDQIRADIVADLLIDGTTDHVPAAASGIRAEVVVTVPVLALLEGHADDVPATADSSAAGTDATAGIVTDAAAGAHARTDAGDPAGAHARTDADDPAGAHARTDADDPSGDHDRTDADNQAGAGAEAAAGDRAGAADHAGAGDKAAAGVGADAQAEAPADADAEAPAEAEAEADADADADADAGGGGRVETDGGPTAPSPTAPPTTAPPARTRLGDRLMGSDPPVVEGVGPIPLSVARQLCGGESTWMRVLTHPETGMVLSVGRDRYKPPKPLRRLVRWRSDRCMAPGCSMPASRCEIDHQIRWTDGGETSLDNNAPFCKGHHLVKDNADWVVRQIAGSGGAVLWISPTGREYVVQPERRVPAFTTGASAAEPAAPF